jgi:hypothetical protein
MEEGYQRSDYDVKPKLSNEELISILKKRRDTIIEMEPRLVVQKAEEETVEMEKKINDIVQKHLLNMVNEINSSIKKMEAL